ncbi:MAG: hypothetical protein Q7U92_20700 [Bradyrhizobium sp.]|uniref:hypothetical protein n=1 Tax=Bradyrhizobium sp. TaxID=376 RepID=UPI002726EE12|nr:hypothetical protein [Bradyrhizobium sp.]MDO9061420.1 hypothetical protein [Bradyrhizobium sp.]MDO9564397.1 hypothetical protein [Bradyrhizobium sp.]MDP3691285.1 hypothetical protein [Bradyrhizobium sp.]
MLDSTGTFSAWLGTRGATASAALLIFALATAAASAQAAPPPSLGIQSPAQQSMPDRTQPPAPQQNETAPPSRPENPGLINEIEKLWEKSKSILPTLKSPQEAIENLNTRAKDATRDAGEGLSRLAKPSLMVTGRMGCPVSANGAPDCKAGADKLCQSKGYQEGKSLDTDAAEKCSAKAYLPGRKREPGDCRTENYVTRALCQ